MRHTGFTLIELLVTMTIIVLMALVAIPGFGKSQRLIELQSKSEEIKAGLDEMHTKAMNPEKGIANYYAYIDATNNKVEFGSGSTTVYKTVNLTTDQAMTISAPTYTYLVCESGKSYCCSNTSSATCTTPFNNTGSGTYFFTLTNTDKTTTFKIFASPFRVTATTP